MSISIFIVENHPVMREMLREYLVMVPDLEICGMAETAEAALEALDAAAPDVVLVDVSLPGRNGMELVEEIRERWGTPCVIHSAHDKRTYVDRAFACGAVGYVLKGNPRDVRQAIVRVLDGEIYLSPGLRQRLDYESNAGGTWATTRVSSPGTDPISRSPPRRPRRSRR